MVAWRDVIDLIGLLFIAGGVVYAAGRNAEKIRGVAEDITELKRDVRQVRDWVFGDKHRRQVIGKLLDEEEENGGGGQ